MSNNPCRKVIISKNGKAKRLKHDTHELLFITYVAIKIVVKFQAEEFFQVVLRVVELLHKYAWRGANIRIILNCINNVRNSQVLSVVSVITVT